MTRYLIASFLILFSTTPYAQNQLFTLPINSLNAVQNDGQILFVSSDGRYIIRGELFSVFYKKPLTSMAEIQDAVTRMDFKKAGINVQDLNGFTIGTGKQVTVFIDPLCGHCQALVKDAQKLTDRYLFTFVVVPALGEKSNTLSKKFHCAADKKQAQRALLAMELDTLPDVSKCDLANYEQTLLIAQLMGIRGVPYIVSPSGQFFNGRPNDLNKWLDSVQ